MIVQELISMSSAYLESLEMSYSGDIDHKTLLKILEDDMADRFAYTLDKEVK